MKCDWCGSTNVKPTGGPKTWGNTQILVCECGHEFHEFDGDRVPDSLNTLDAAKPDELQGLIIFHHKYFGYVAVPAETATPEDLSRRKANGWNANTYVPASDPGLAARMTLGHLIEKIESLEYCKKLDDDTIKRQKELLEQSSDNLCATAQQNERLRDATQHLVEMFPVGTLDRESAAQIREEALK